MAENRLINELPVTTYRALKVNGAILPAVFGGGGSVRASVAVENTAPGEPHGVTVSTDGAERIRELAASLQAMRSHDGDQAGVIPPNGDTTPRHEAQPIRTGMGIEIDRLLERDDVPTMLIETEPGVQLTDPLILRVTPAEESGDSAAPSYARRLIHVGKDSSVTVVIDTAAGTPTNKEAEVNPELPPAALGEQTLFLVEDGGSLTLAMSQLLPYESTYFHDIGGVCGEGARATLIQLSLGARETYNGVLVDLAGDGASLDDASGALVHGDSVYDMNYVALHRGRDTGSLMNMNTVLLDRATKVFRGTIDFRQGSTGSKGDEQEDVLILSPDATNRTMPVILCQEEDMEGRHGATVGDLAEDVLFYMASRGIDETEARRIIIRSRLMSVARRIPDPALTVRIERYIRSIL